MSERSKREPYPANELELLAIAEQFATEHAAGANPRLAEYLRRYPEHAAELTAFVTAPLAEDARLAGAVLSPGTLRALARIFSSATHGEPQAAVAEQRAT
jgi:hypothetical protein